ncbi:MULTISPECIES: ParB/Srx family N-terminal domain-containing protein [unclassified Nodularia (in: cyanobacteria)]|uniref:ParB/Srx family N-terminal domain-containing protein n=1 Tax=unclassified Nodularia (in: cyanobacteria) TaxID=2656917 RepID=UPI001881DC8E|nr:MULTISPECIES: ParB/Srx family N-terminal domain-containing protein [unclassified Nodularia (in: cyanobacteria)]MBE9200665.1 Rho termination factor N-terminal domain-containing protein [Nodularia sp. LEGE 06071]MCC2694804.1 Rho termination factor N-terminal domain-containing protein [Nodularia sp. LEGE 04288]
MKLSNSSIAVRKISSTVPCSQFSQDELNHAAELILKLGGIINPLIVRITSTQSYEVVDGHFEYYAAARAKEIDSQKGEYIGAFIIEPDNEDVLQQIALIRKKELVDKELTQKLQNITDQIAQLAESVKRIENTIIPPNPGENGKTKVIYTLEELEKMKVSELKKIARKQQIPGYSRMKKDQLIEAIMNNQKS